MTLRHVKLCICEHHIQHAVQSSLCSSTNVLHLSSVLKTAVVIIQMCFSYSSPEEKDEWIQVLRVGFE